MVVIATRKKIRCADRIGQKLGTFTLEEFLGRKGGNYLFKVRCECGATSEKHVNQLAYGKARCPACQYLYERHGGSKTREHCCWNSMIQRCTNATCKAYAYYGARGIQICKRWRESFTSFCADMGPRPTKHSIERINNDGGYTCGRCDECVENGWPANCRWATAKEQAANKRRQKNGRDFTIHGVKRSMTEWAPICGITKERMRQRFNAFSPEHAVLFYESARTFLGVTDMPKVVEEFPAELKEIEQYLDGRVWEFTVGVDFECPVSKFSGRLRSAAKDRGLKAKLRTLGNKLYVQAVKRT